MSSQMSGAEALLILEQDERISQREYLLITQFISRKDFSLASLDKIIGNKEKKLSDLDHDIQQLDLFDGVEISIINKIMRLDPDTRTKEQQELLNKYSIQKVFDRTALFRVVISEMIKEESEDLVNLKKIRNIYVDYLPEAIISPRSSRSELETSPTRQFNTSPILSPRSSSPRSPSPLNTPRSLRSSGQRLLLTPRKLSRKSKSFEHK